MCYQIIKRNPNRLLRFLTIGMFILLVHLSTFAQVRAPLRRPVSPVSPMFVIHIDTWNWADPAKIISLVPDDIKPYVVFNVSLSVSDFVIGKYPFTICESWIRTCAEKGVWVTIQPASGYKCNFPYEISDQYEYFYKNYPNFLGWNFAEQNWGFPSDAEFRKRQDLFVHLLKLGDKYGGYLFVSNFMPVGNYTNSIGQLKDHAAFEQACKTYSRNYILEDKFTFPSGFYDNESGHLGAFLSGYTDNYGIRFDECGWRANSNPFAESSGIAAVMEHFLLTGATVTDGPETIPMQATHQVGTFTNSAGLTSKKFEMYPQMVDVHVDMFRKIVDGTFRIPSREEVIERTKVAYVNDITQGTNLQKYSSTSSLYTGLYAMDGELDNNTTWFKKTGRYPSIPMMHKYSSDLDSKFQVVVKQSGYTSRWPNVATKVAEFDNLFPSEYSGDGYAARINNTWMTYNPYVNGDVKSLATIPLKYNTCESMSLSYSRFTAGIINEFSDKLQIYLNNYCTSATYGIREDVITIAGCSSEPTYTFKDRGRVASTVTTTWENGTFAIKILHNGPLDININCSGNATDRLTTYPAQAAMVAPAKPPVYYGPRQYEAENFDYLNISSVSQTVLQNYTAMGYLTFGSSASARIVDTISVVEGGNYALKTKYRAPTVNVNSVDLYINGVLAASPTFPQTVSDNRVWSVVSQNVNLIKGENVVEFRSKATVPSFFIDNIVVAKDNYDFTFDVPSDQANNPTFVSLQSGTLGVIDGFNGNTSLGNCLKAYTVGSTNNTGVANLDLFSTVATDYSVTWKEYSLNSGSKKGVLLRANGSSSYAQGLGKGYLLTTQHNADNTITLTSYLVNDNSLVEMKTFTPSFEVLPGNPCWFRASAVGNLMMIESSVDGSNWVGGSATSFTDNTYMQGSTQFVWGLGSDALNWAVDDISFKSATVSVTPSILTELNYTKDSGPSASKSVVFSASSLSGDVVVTASDDYEVSLSASTGFSSSVTIAPTDGMVPTTLIYVRLKKDLPSGNYVGSLTFGSTLMQDQHLVLSGEVQNPALTKVYDFQSDAAITTASTPPAFNITVGTGNTATAGVVSYTDSKGATSNMLKPYSGGQRESTGVLNLNLFSQQATNYSVTWKQHLGSATDNYKIGVVLRGDPTKIGNGTIGYVQGMMQGYAFIAYANRGSSNTEFRIYKSTSGTGLETYANVGTGSLNPTVGLPVWFRASVSGNTIVYLKFEYSLNGTSWTKVAEYNDAAGSYLQGATQFIWGLGAGSVNYYIDDIKYNGVAKDEDGTSTAIVDNSKDAPTVVSELYFNIVGQMVPNPYNNRLKGIYIVKSFMSDGSVKSRKILVK